MSSTVIQILVGLCGVVILVGVVNNIAYLFAVVSTLPHVLEGRRVAYLRDISFLRFASAGAHLAPEGLEPHALVAQRGRRGLLMVVGAAVMVFAAAAAILAIGAPPSPQR